MAKLAALSRLVRIKAKGFTNQTRSFGKAVKGAAKPISLIAAGGAIVGTSFAPPGARPSGAIEGAFIAGTAAAVGTIGTKIIFRRIRGRIIPIRVKTK